MPHLQVALDLLSIEDALTIAEKAYRAGADWIEAGTPLIKNHGMRAVKMLRKAFPKATIVADLKTADTGDLEVEMAAKAGANVVTVLAMADDFTIKRAVNQANVRGLKVMADLLEVENLVERALELEELGVDYLLVHTPIDLQKVKLKRVEESLQELKKLRSETKLPLAAAGGITVESAKLLKKVGVEIFVVGSAITKAKDVEAEVRKFCSVIGLKREPEERMAISEELLIKRFEALPTPFISDAMERFGAMRGLKPLLEKRIAGRAFTVKTLAGDWGKVVKAIDLAPPHSVIVVDAQGSELAVWGELATRSAMARKIKGVVIDGAVRDARDIARLGFPVWAKHFVASAGEPHGHGKLQVPIACCGQVVNPGDIIIADEDGVVVVPKEEAQDVLVKAEEVRDKEKKYKESIASGKSLGELFGL